MSEKTGEELKNACYSFTNLTPLPISISANTHKKTKDDKNELTNRR